MKSREKVKNFETEKLRKIQKESEQRYKKLCTKKSFPFVRAQEL